MAKCNHDIPRAGNRAACLKLAVFLVTLMITQGCTRDPQSSDAAPGDVSQDNAPVITNRIDVPSTVRQNLGITFVKVERRHVASTIRVPGRFELLPAAHREYHATLAGRVELLVQQYQRVEAGTPLYRIDSPQWRRMQGEISDKVNAIRQAKQKLVGMTQRIEAITKHRERLKQQEQVWLDRQKQIVELIAAGSGAASELAEARSQLAGTQTELAKVEEEFAEVAQEQKLIESELAGHRASMPLLYADAIGESAEDGSGRLDLTLAPAAALLGLSVKELRRNVGKPGESLPLWRTLDQVVVKARETGVVESLGVTNGGWVEPGTLVVKTVDPTRLRFKGVGLQANLGRLREGMSVRIVPPRGGDSRWEGTISSSLMLGLNAEPLQRTIDLFANVAVSQESPLPAWARPGVSAEMEVVLDQTAEPELAIPTEAVIKDGLERILFRRDPRDPDKVIRLEADLGISDGRWIAIQSGVTDGDEVVLHGVYELMLASGGAKQRGGHFHADGTYHEGRHD